jgi:hypothetical protein
MISKKTSAQAALALAAMMSGGLLPPLGPVDDRPVAGECECGGTIHVTPVSKKPRCNKCGKVGRFKVVNHSAERPPLDDVRGLPVFKE